MSRQQRLYLALATIVIALVAIGLSIIAATAAQAEWPHDQFNCKAWRADLYWRTWARRHCPGYRWRYRRHRHVYRAPQPDSSVMRAQIRLREIGYDLEADGLMGPDTRNALRRFQEAQDISPTGNLGPRTKRALWRAERDGEDIEDEPAPEWSRRPEICREDDGRECTCKPIVVFSGEEVVQNAEKEAKKRWRGEVRALLGETFMSWNQAAGAKIVRCWETGTGERAVGDRVAHTRCVVEARACFGPPTPSPQQETRRSSYGPRVTNGRE